MLVEQRFDTGEVVLNYVETPHSRPPLVMLHGITMAWQYYLPVLPALSARWHTYALDQRGHGKSGRVQDGYRWESFAQDCIALLKGQAKEPAVLIGHSLGAMVAIEVAARAPELVRALVLEDPPLYTLGQALDRFVLFRDLAAAGLPLSVIADRLAAANPGRDAVWCRRRARFLSLLDPAVVTMLIDGVATKNYDTAKFLSGISYPVLLLRADPTQGGAITDEDEKKAIAALKEVVLVQFPGVGHTILNTVPERAGRLIGDFLESLE